MDFKDFWNGIGRYIFFQTLILLIGVALGFKFREFSTLIYATFAIILIILDRHYKSVRLQEREKSK